MQDFDIDQGVGFDNRSVDQSGNGKGCTAARDRDAFTRLAGIGEIDEICRTAAADDRVIAGTTRKRIVGIAAQQRVIAQATAQGRASSATAVEQIIARATKQQITTGSTDQRVIAIAAVKRVITSAAREHVIVAVTRQAVGTGRADDILDIEEFGIAGVATVSNARTWAKRSQIDGHGCRIDRLNTTREGLAKIDGVDAIPAVDRIATTARREGVVMAAAEKRIGSH